MNTCMYLGYSTIYIYSNLPFDRNICDMSLS